MGLLLKNLRGVLTASSATEIAISENQAIYIEGENVAAVGDPEVLAQAHPDAEVHDCRNLWALPGFVDPHTHPIFYKTREAEFEMRALGKSYEEIAAAGGGIRNSARTFRGASFDELTELTYKRIRRFLEYGTTTIEAKSGYGLTVEDELKSLRVLKKVSEFLPITIVNTFLGAHEVPDEYQNNREGYVDLVIEEMIPQVAEEGLAQFCDVFCEKNVFTVDQSERILRAGIDHGLKPKLHADELHYTGSAELAAKVQATSADHLLKASDEGIRDMKAAGVTPVLLPGTAFFLGKESYAPARKMIASGLPVALATDFNPGSSTTQNMQIILTIACIYMHMSAEEVLAAATRNSALAIDMLDSVGTIEPGKKADIVLMDIENLQYLPYHYAVNHVRMVFRHGKIVQENQIS